ncbi:MAG: sugar ABC transporter permease [Candidatus Dormiibacterota bacterium]
MAVTQIETARRRGRPAVALRRGAAGYGFTSIYVLMLVLLGVVPAAYAIALSVTNASGRFVGLANFLGTARDFRFLPAFVDDLLYLLCWLPLLLVAVVGLALLLHGKARRASGAFRFLFYLPGALTGAASVLLWLFMLDPDVSPAVLLFSMLGQHSVNQVLAPAHLPILFAVIAFWTGAGGWILVLYGALNNISIDVLEAARMDGAGVFQTAWRIKLPMIRRTIAYMLILAFAGGSQLFVEPSMLAAATGTVSPSWSPNQLAYVFAFQQADFNSMAAVAVDLLVIGLICAAIVVFRTGLFEVE